MPRHRRVTPPGYVQHVLNRGNERATIFHKPADYEAFLSILSDGLARVPLRIFAFCLMRNHFHLVMDPPAVDSIPAYMRWTMNVHVRRYRRHYGTVGNGHIYQGRYKNFLIEDDIHLLTVIRYVEANPLRAGLVDRAEDWPWSSLRLRSAWNGRPLVSPWPFERTADWPEVVNNPFSIEELQRVRESAGRGTPYGSAEWTEQTARRLGLESTVRAAHRPERGTIPMPRPAFE